MAYIRRNEERSRKPNQKEDRNEIKTESGMGKLDGFRSHFWR